ncbi:MAG: hypothetical protein EB127_32055, partial [Alphaproteobacteria bacterium]|nr:hypothetical protein [Alphaproteobacteria bacterium]
MKILNKISFFIVCGFISASSANADKPIIVAVIDSGIGNLAKNSISMCKHGHRDFTKTSLIDTSGHGSHISGLIDQYAKNSVARSDDELLSLKDKKINYCQVILKFYDPRTATSSSTVRSMVNALRWAINIKVDIINISAGGGSSNDEEKKYIKRALDTGIKVVVAAGNYGCELGSATHKKVNNKTTITGCSFYPAMYDERLIVVGNLDVNNNRYYSSNYGNYVNSWEHGVSRISYG